VVATAGLVFGTGLVVRENLLDKVATEPANQSLFLSPGIDRSFSFGTVLIHGPAFCVIRGWERLEAVVTCVLCVREKRVRV
jgi:hypothetical protein